jgi:ABC-2 type transport system permease protein
MRSFGQVLRANGREFRRDPTALMWALIFPILITGFMGIVFANEKLTFKIGVVNEAGTAGDPLVDAFRQHPALDVSTGNRAHELDALKAGKRRAVVIVPPGAGTADPAAPAALTVYYDPSHQNAPLVISALQEVIAGTNARLTGITPPLALLPESTSAGEFRRIEYVLPGVLSMALMHLGLFVTAPLLVSLRERAVLRRMSVTPLSRSTLLAAQVVFRLGIALLQSGIVLTLGRIAFGVRITLEALPGLIGFTLLGAAVFVTLGYFLAGLARTEESIQGLIGLPNVLFMMLSGMFFPISDMPGWTRPIVDAIPLTFLADALRQLMVQAAPLYGLTTDFAVLAAWAIGCTVLAVRFFKWEPRG